MGSGHDGQTHHRHSGSAQTSAGRASPVPVVGRFAAAVAGPSTLRCGWARPRAGGPTRMPLRAENVSRGTFAVEAVLASGRVALGAARRGPRRGWTAKRFIGSARVSSLGRCVVAAASYFETRWRRLNAPPNESVDRYKRSEPHQLRRPAWFERRPPGGLVLTDPVRRVGQKGDSRRCLPRRQAQWRRGLRVGRILVDL